MGVVLALLSVGAVVTEEDHSREVELILSKMECEKGERITVAYQRVANERDPQETSDFIGLFRRDDPTALAPFDVSPGQVSAQTGEVKLTCRLSGEMEVRIVRIPGQIYGKATITVYSICPSANCGGHGHCQKGACVCDAGWDGDSCDLLSSDGASVAWLDNPKGEFYPRDTMRVKISHASTDAVSSGLDYIGVFPFSGSSEPVGTYVSQFSRKQKKTCEPQDL